METWITNEIKNATVKRRKSFKKRINNPAETKRERYETARNNVTNSTRIKTRNKSFQKLGENPTPKSVYKTLITKKNQAQTTTNLSVVEFRNK